MTNNATTWKTKLAKLLPLPLELKGHTDGILFRAVPAKEKDTYLVNIVNYNHEKEELELTGANRRFELISQQELPEKFTLSPLVPLFLKVSVKSE